VELPHRLAVFELGEDDMVLAFLLGSAPSRVQGLGGREGVRHRRPNGQPSDGVLAVDQHANAHADTMSVVDTDARRVLDTVRTGRRPTSLVASPSGDRVHV
jgi:YVTN family beta-propeller protein